MNTITGSRCERDNNYLKNTYDSISYKRSNRNSGPFWNRAPLPYYPYPSYPAPNQFPFGGAPPPFHPPPWHPNAWPPLMPPPKPPQYQLTQPVPSFSQAWQDPTKPEEFVSPPVSNNETLHPLPSFSGLVENPGILLHKDFCPEPSNCQTFELRPLVELPAFGTYQEGLTGPADPPPRPSSDDDVIRAAAEAAARDSCGNISDALEQATCEVLW